MIWGFRDGVAAVRRRLVRTHLWVWILSGMFLALRYYQLRPFMNADHWYFTLLHKVTLVGLVKSFFAMLYGSTCPLQISPLLGLAATFLLYIGLKRYFRFTLFILLWIVIAPAFQYPDPGIFFHRLHLASFGAAAALGFILVFCLGGIQDLKRRSRAILVLDWVVVVSVMYWVFELLWVGWVDYVYQQNLTHNMRLYAALVAAIGVLLRCIVTRHPTPRLARTPLRALSAGLFLLILGWYIAMFLARIEVCLEESRRMALIPKAIVAARSVVPEKTLMFFHWFLLIILISNIVFFLNLSILYLFFLILFLNLYQK